MCLRFAWPLVRCRREVTDPEWLMSPASQSDVAQVLSDAPRRAGASSGRRYRMVRLNKDLIGRS